MAVVALCGRRCVGKDEVAKYLADRHGYVHLKISSCLKSACGAIFGFTHDQLESGKDRVDPRFGVTPRYLMQRFGTDVTQTIVSHLPNDRVATSPESFWMRSMIERHFADAQRSRKNIVVSDLRFPAECDELRRAHGAIIVKILRPMLDSADASDVVDRHASESYADAIDADLVICNDSADLGDLYRKVDIHLLPLISARS
jgi:hypothetical protein